MSLLISTSSPDSGDGVVKCSFTTKSAKELMESEDGTLRYDSNYTNCLNIIAIDEFPFTNAYRTTYPTGYAGDKAAAIIATASSTGIFKDLFDCESGYQDGSYTTMYYVYNKNLNKAIALIGGSQTEIQSSYYPLTLCTGTHLQFYTRWFLGGGTIPYLYEVGISSSTDSTIGMEFINDMVNNILVRVTLGVTLAVATSGFILPTVSYSSDIALTNKTLLVNGNDISKTRYLSVALGGQFYPLFGAYELVSRYSTVDGYLNVNTTGLCVNGYTQGDIEQFNSAGVKLTKDSIMFYNEAGTNSIKIAGAGYSPHYKAIHILDTSNLNSTVSLTSSLSSALILAYSTQSVFNGTYIQPVFIPYNSNGLVVASTLYSIGDFSGQAYLSIIKTGNTLSLYSQLYGDMVNSVWTIKFWVFEYTMYKSTE